jgi:glycosyltransferase involved in cell wall biosynthesis
LNKLNLKHNIFYWSPYLVSIATPKAVVNSAKALKTYGEKYECSIINFFGEFNSFQEDLKSKNINLINFFNKKLIKFLPKEGRLQSRFSFALIFVLSFLPLKRLITNQKPDYLIVQLITSLPMILILLFKFRTKFILRISGLPKVGFFRKLLWKIALKKFYLVTCPTKATFDYIKSLKIIEDDKIKLLYDPIIGVNRINLEKKKREITDINNYYLAAGRLTKQKNFLFLCKAFHKVVLKYPRLKLVIAGEGEDRNLILAYIEKNKLKKNIFLVGYVDNIFPLMVKAEAFILSSLWEDPGFVLIEAAFCRTLVFSSNCNTGPKEIIQDNVNGILFESNNLDNFINKFDLLISKKNKKSLLLKNLINSKKFTQFSHYQNLKEML